MLEKPIIRLEHVSKTFDGVKVLEDVNLSIYPGQTTVIIGASGCGKTLLLRHIIALTKPDSGKVFFQDLEITCLSERKLAPVRKHFGIVFQGGALFDSMTVNQNICFPLIEHNITTQAKAEEKCRHVLAMVGLGETGNKFPEELSGGQKKRIALARAIVMDPQIILYDEPTTGLDPIRADLINELILKLQKELATTSIVVTHDLASAKKVGDRIVMLHQGRIIADTTPAQLGQVDNDTVTRFINGQASEEDLAPLKIRHSTKVI